MAPKPASAILIAPLIRPSTLGVRITAIPHEPPGGTAYPSMHSPKVMPKLGLVDWTVLGTNEPGPALYSRTNHSEPGRPTMPVPTSMSAIDSCGCCATPMTWRVDSATCSPSGLNAAPARVSNTTTRPVADNFGWALPAGAGVTPSREDRCAMQLGEIDIGHQHVAVGRCAADRRACRQQIGRPGDERDLAAVTRDRRLGGAQIGADDLCGDAGGLTADEHDGFVGSVVPVDLWWASVDARRQRCTDHQVDGIGGEGDVGPVSGDRRRPGAAVRCAVGSERDPFDGVVRIGIEPVPHVHLRGGEPTWRRARAPIRNRFHRVRVGCEGDELAVVGHRRLTKADVLEGGGRRGRRSTGDGQRVTGLVGRHGEIDDDDTDQVGLRGVEPMRVCDHRACAGDRRWVPGIDLV